MVTQETEYMKFGEIDEHYSVEYFHINDTNTGYFEGRVLDDGLVITMPPKREPFDKTPAMSQKMKLLELISWYRYTFYDSLAKKPDNP